MSSKLIPAYGCIDFSCYFRRAQNLGRLPRSEPAAAQRWLSTIGCPAWQPRPSICTAVVRDKRRPSLCC